MQARRGFTLIELLVVIAVIGILAGLLLPALFTAQQRSMKTRCMNNMKQIGTGLMVYRDDFIYKGREMNPLRVTHLYTLGYVANEGCFYCPMDSTDGEDGGKPNIVDNQYAELDEKPDPPTYAQGALFCSYMYEFSMAADCSWGWVGYVTLPARAKNVEYAFVDLDGNSGSAKWGEVKTAQMRYGDTFYNAVPGSATLKPSDQWHGYSPTRFPIMRCFWHTDDPDTHEVTAITNLAYQGNVFLSESEWEKASTSY